jgi:hypothetical protein
LNYLTIVNRILDRIDESNITDTTSSSNKKTPKLVCQFINEVIAEIHGLNSQWSWGEQEYSTAYIAGTTTYTLPSTINRDTIDVVRIGDTPLTYIDKHVYDTNREMWQTKADPAAPSYILFQNDLILVTPPQGASIPSGSYIKITYQLKPAELVENTDTPPIPDDFHWILIVGGEAKIKEFYNWPDASMVQSKYQDWLNSLLRNNKNVGQAALQMTIDDTYQPDWTRFH